MIDCSRVSPFCLIYSTVYKQRSINMATRSYAKFFSKRCLRRKPSAIRSLQPLVRAPGMISLGGGMPNSSMFPISEISFKIKGDGNPSVVLGGNDCITALQYGPSYGLPALIEELRHRQVEEHKPKYNEWEIIVSTGSQDALGKAFDMLLDEDDALLVENPSYSGSLASLNAIGCKLIGVDIDEHGLIPDQLERALNEWDHPKPPKALYTIPTGQNPSGATITNERRKTIYEICCRHDLLILEDDPYWFLRLNKGEALESFFSMDKEQRVLRFDSLSKIVSSGLRIGWASGPSALVEKMQLDMQATELHTSGVSQMIVASLLKHWKNEGFYQHIDAVQDFYRNQRNLFLKYAEKHLTGLAEWSSPSAGMFLWIKFKNVDDTFDLIKEKALEKKVLLVPGRSFSPTNSPSPYARAAFSVVTNEQMDESLRRLAELLKESTVQ